MLRPASPAPVLEPLPATNSPRPVIWSLMVSRLVTTVHRDTLADAVKDVLQDTLATHCLDRDVMLATMKSMVTAITVTKEEVKAAMLVCAAAR